VKVSVSNDGAVLSKCYFLFISLEQFFGQTLFVEIRITQGWVWGVRVGMQKKRSTPTLKNIFEVILTSDHNMLLEWKCIDDEKDIHSRK
jgi:hypothetical protein